MISSSWHRISIQLSSDIFASKFRHKLHLLSSQAITTNIWPIHFRLQWCHSLNVKFFPVILEFVKGRTAPSGLDLVSRNLLSYWRLTVYLLVAAWRASLLLLLRRLSRFASARFRAHSTRRVACQLSDALSLLLTCWEMKVGSVCKLCTNKYIYLLISFV